MTLAELTQVEIHENGKTTHIASFDDYLSTATKLHQKLLVELKSVPGNKKTSSNSLPRSMVSSC
jgi:hypothetical protein